MDHVYRVDRRRPGRRISAVASWDLAGMKLRMPPRRRPRVTFSVRVNKEITERVRVFVADQRGPPLRLTMSSFVEEALLAYMQVLQRQLREGGTDPPASPLVNELPIRSINNHLRPR